MVLVRPGKPGARTLRGWNRGSPARRGRAPEGAPDPGRPGWKPASSGSARRAAVFRRFPPSDSKLQTARLPRGDSRTALAEPELAVQWNRPATARWTAQNSSSSNSMTSCLPIRRTPVAARPTSASGGVSTEARRCGEAISNAERRAPTIRAPIAERYSSTSRNSGTGDSLPPGVWGCPAGGAPPPLPGRGERRAESRAATLSEPGRHRDRSLQRDRAGHRFGARRGGRAGHRHRPPGPSVSGRWPARSKWPAARLCRWRAM